MRIAVDARPLSPPITGIGVYTRALLEQLLDSDHDWLLYSDRPLVEGPWTGHPRVTVRHGNAPPRSLLSLLYANVHFLRWAKRDRAQVFWSPRHHLPFLLPRRLPGVVTVHDLLWRRYPDTMPWRNRMLERAAMASSLRRASHIIAVSDFTAGELAHFYPDTPQRSSVIHEAGRDLGKPEVVGFDFPYFLFVGTAEPRKNTERLFRAFARFLAGGEYAHWLVCVGGTGWGDVDLARDSAALGIRDRVILEGYASDERLAGLYSRAQALVLPSLYEGFGLPVVEAMSNGIPVIVSDGGALAEVAGSAGVLVDPASEHSIASALRELATDHERRRALGANARERSGEFSWARAARETLALLESAGS